MKAHEGSLHAPDHSASERRSEYQNVGLMNPKVQGRSTLRRGNVLGSRSEPGSTRMVTGVERVFGLEERSQDRPRNAISKYLRQAHWWCDRFCVAPRGRSRGRRKTL